ncbi:Arylsulfatase [Thalassoglobus neptunius]|uniref:Arylsulfatase n=1 Tax=Thalassoglobus neptunius TaxID=1938619 RepID=A0A5C5WI56_9PLAN|nr:arylsulfatase [Thalassoglobus neptunius]TWT49799.1 Arylsulfatase [Thalassoglobus neptunius]
MTTYCAAGMRPIQFIFAILFSLLVFSTVSSQTLANSDDRPNIIIILVDDMGFSDIGCYGGEIQTPNIDQMAAKGVKFSQFYNSARCCPTRATLMTGLHPHQVGIGHMTNPPNSQNHDLGIPSYRGFLNRKCATIAEILQPAGYSTLMAGKWHLGMAQEDLWPLQRGFEKYYGSLPGATRFFHPIHPRGMTLGNEHIEEPESTTDEPFYTTDAFTDYAIQFIQEQQTETNGDKPFFLYLAYTAPHWPLQAHEDDIARYRGKYQIGWDQLREQRLKKQIELGLLPEGTHLSPRYSDVPAWESLDAETRDEMDLKMSVYAAMIDRVDQNLGRLFDSLETAGIADNTLIMFLSDNGGCAEGGILGRGEFRDVEKRNQETANSYGTAWANASNTPFRLYKHYAHEGGTSTPFIISWPKQVDSRSDWYRDPAQLIDIMPTVLDAAHVEYPEELHGNPIPALDGISLLPAVENQPLNRKSPIFIEHENNAFVRDQEWKLVGKGVSPLKGVVPDKWELYNIENDRTELNDLAATHPEKVKELSSAWNAWAERVGVYPKKKLGSHQNKKNPAKKKKKTKKN